MSLAPARWTHRWLKSSRMRRELVDFKFTDKIAMLSLFVHKPSLGRSNGYRRRFSIYLTFVFVLFLFVNLSPNNGRAESANGVETEKCTADLLFNESISPATLDYLQRGIQFAQRNGCGSLLLRINTPGGNLQSTHLIVQEILSSPLPLLCLVTPEGGRAGSAGAIILLACHVAGMLPSTNVGAATPIMSSGESISDDLKKKLIQDTQSWVIGIARRRSRNEDFAMKIVTEAQSVTAEEAKNIGAIDILAPDLNRFLQQSEGRLVRMKGDEEAKIQAGARVFFDHDWRYQVLQFLTDPQTAYFIFMISLVLLYIEITHAGAIAPGVMGTLGMVASLLAFHRLEAYWGGVAFIVVGLVLMILEAFITSFGILGIGGVVAFAIGSSLLYDVTIVGSRISPYFIWSTSIILGGLMFALAYLAFRTRGRKSRHPLIGHVAQVKSLSASDETALLGADRNVMSKHGMIEVGGELWSFQSKDDVHLQDWVEVLGQSGLILEVQLVDKK